MQKSIRIPKQRKQRYELIKKYKRDRDNMSFKEKMAAREIESTVNKRIKEKIVITLLSVMWLLVGIFGKTPGCEVFGVPFAVLSLFAGLWII